MKTINNYIFKEALNYFLITLFAFSGVLLTVRILKFTNLIVNKGVTLTQVLTVFASIIPTFLEIAIPMSALLGVMLAFARLSGDSEIIIMRASGISLKQLIRPIITYSALTLCLSLYVSTVLRPWGYNTLSKTLFEIARSKTTAGIEGGIFNKLGKLTLYTDSMNHSSGELEKVLVDDYRNAEEKKIITAQSGKITSDEKESSIKIVLYDGLIHEQRKDNYTITEFSDNSITLSPDEIFNPDTKKSNRRHREKSLAELKYDLEHEKKDLQDNSILESLTPKEIKEKKANVIEIMLEKARRFSMPFAALFLSFIGMTLGIQPPRTQKTWGSSLSIGLGVLVFVFYYALLSIGIALAESATVTPIIAVWIPNVFALGVAILFLRKIHTESWQSVAEIIDSFIPAIKKIFKMFYKLKK